VDAIVKLDEGLDLDFKSKILCVKEQLNELDSQSLCFIVITRFSEIEKRPEEKIKSLNSALRLSDRSRELQDLITLLKEELEKEGSGFSLTALLEGFEDTILETNETLGVFFVLLIEVVFDSGSHVNANVFVFAGLLLAVEVGRLTTKGSRELVNEESCHLGEARGILFTTLCKEVHFLLL